MKEEAVTMKGCITREIYLGRVAPYLGKDIIKVFVGQRRVGKSYMLYQVMDRIRKNNPKARILYINKELHEFSFIRSSDDLLEYIESKRDRRRRLHLFIDEIQDIEAFENALRSLQASGMTDIYCTGSNANLLSGELATYLSGRYIEIDVHALSYEEFLLFHGIKDEQASFLKYIRYGGLPYLRNLALEDAVIFDYLRNIRDAVIFKDVVARHGIRNVDFLQRLVDYVAEHVGSILSAKRISDFLKSQRTNISPHVVLNYLDHLTEACFLFKVRRSDMVGKRVFEVGEKYYLQDLGLRHAIVGFRQSDINKVLENIVFNHLKIAGYDVTVGVEGEREIDFVCRKSGEKLYVQVAYLIPDDGVKEREFGNLLRVRDNYPKVVASMDEPAGGGYEGIEHVRVSDFLRRLAPAARA